MYEITGYLYMQPLLHVSANVRHLQGDVIKRIFKKKSVYIYNVKNVISSVGITAT